MKKPVFFLSIALFALALTSWEWKKNQHPTVEKADVIACLNMETQQAYQLEASTPAFANLHPSPLDVAPADLLGSMIQFDAADGNKANAYFIPAKKKTNKWLIVIQEWWGLNDNIKMEADQYYLSLIHI